MQKLLGHVAIKIDPQLHVKDPLTSSVGQEIIRQSVALISSDGLEAFTFKKLASELGSTESTIYRYFKNKQQLMMYLASWYWSMLEWKVVFATANVGLSKEKLDKALLVLSAPVNGNNETDFFNEHKMHGIVVSESFKAFVVKNLLKKERVGYFSAYSNLCIRIADIVLENKKSYKYPKALAATLIEAAHYQIFLQSKLPELTDLPKGDNHLYTMLHHLAFTALEDKK